MTIDRQILSWPLPTASTTGTAASALGTALWTHQLIVTGSGTVTATAVVEGTNDPTGTNGWQTIATLNASGTTSASDSVVVQHTWAQLRARSTALTGTGAAAVVNSVGV